MRLDNVGVSLGADTYLAKRDKSGGLALEGERHRIFVLRSVAHGRPVDPSMMGAFDRASQHARAGNEAMAAMSLALTKQPMFADPSAVARRLFIADGLIGEGVDPRDIWTALEFDPDAFDALAKYDPAEARNPAGEGRLSGEWTRNAEAAATRSAIRARVAWLLERLPSAAFDLVRIARFLDLPLAALSEALHADPTGGAHFTGPVRGHPELRYSRFQDELGLTIINNDTGHAIGTLFPTGVRGRYADYQHTVTADMEGNELVIRSGTETMSQARRNEPQMCPEPPLPDYKGMIGERGDRAREYAEFMKLKVNPDNPTPPEMAYFMPDPRGGKPVSYDDCQRSSGAFMEFKGLGFEELLDSPPIRANLTKEWLGQATRQALSRSGHPLIWNFAERGAIEFARSIFSQDPLLAGIELRYEPWLEGDRWKRKPGRWERILRRAILRKYFLGTPSGHSNRAVAVSAIKRESDVHGV